VAVIPNGLDLRRADAMLSRGLVRERWQVAGGDRVVGTVARLTPQKGIHDLIDAARLVCNERPQVRFIHMGTGPLAQSIARSLSAGGLGHRLQLVGHVRDPMSLLAGLDLFVLPSLWEGLPIALLEAMAAGLPVVATRVAGIDEVIEDGRSGLLVPPADPAALARAITELVDDDERRRCLGQGARERVRCFDAAPFAARYRDLFLEVLTRRT
jgi:glycosyltransferase involved in cell wall biosynthesis